MNRKLTAKIQKLNPKLSASLKAFSSSLIIEPDNKDLLLKKGVIYTVFDINGSSEFDISLITKVINDVLYDSYYQSDNISPIQSLEKSILDVRDKVTKLSNESTRSKDLHAEFNILAGALWGNVMYIVQYGKGRTFLIRGGDVKEINSSSEGNFSAASGIVKDGDVVVFCTSEFAKKYSPEKLLTAEILEENLPVDASCLILKFVVDAAFSSAEMIDFGIKNSLKTKGFNLGKMTAAISTLFGKLKPKQTSDKKTPKIIMRPEFKARPASIAAIIIPVTAVLLVLSILFSLNKKSSLNTSLSKGYSNIKAFIQNLSKTRGQENKKQEEKSAESSQSTQTQNSANAVNKPNEDKEVFYDIKITDAVANPTQIAVTNDKVVVADKSSGKIYVSDINTPKFDVLSYTSIFPGIDNLMYANGKLNFSDSAGYKIYDLSAYSLTGYYDQKGLGVNATYLGFIYSISQDILYKYTKSEHALTSSVWAQSSDFKDTRSLSIAISIYLLKNDGTLVSYTKGVRDNFSVTGLDKPFSNPAQVVTSVVFDNIYVADAGNKRVVVLNKKGAFLKQIQSDNWTDLKSIDVSPKEDKLFILNGSKVYEANL